MNFLFNSAETKEDNHSYNLSALLSLAAMSMVIEDLTTENYVNPVEAAVRDMIYFGLITYAMIAAIPAFKNLNKVHSVEQFSKLQVKAENMIKDIDVFINKNKSYLSKSDIEVLHKIRKDLKLIVLERDNDLVFARKTLKKSEEKFEDISKRVYELRKVGEAQF